MRLTSIALGAIILLGSKVSFAAQWQWRVQPSLYRTSEGYVLQRMELQDAYGTRFLVRIAVEETDGLRIHNFRSEHVFNHFRVGDCATVITQGPEVTLANCK